MVYRYGAGNLNFGVYYDKVNRKEYLPSRVRYNQFFFYAIAVYFFATLHSKVRSSNIFIYYLIIALGIG